MNLLEECMKLTPVELHGDIYFKRDDKFAPFGNNKVNGGKLRQCALLFEKNKNLVVNGVITATSMLSPQAPIVSELCKYYDVPCTIYYGGTSYEKLKTMPYPLYCWSNQANIEIPCKCARQSTLQYHVNKRVEKTNELNVKYGMDLEDNLDVFIDSTAKQVKNIPNNLDNLVISCGSAITVIGVLLGINMYKKEIKAIYAIGIAPNRMDKIRKYINLINKKYNIEISLDNLIYVDAFNELKGYKYENTLSKEYDGIVFHSRYESKTFKWIEDNINYKDESTLMWIVGGDLNEIKEQRNI